MYQKDGLSFVDGTDYTHNVIRVTTENGETFAFDMTGAQYGWHEPVTPWQLYNTSRVRAIKEVVPFGETKVFCKTRAKTSGKQQEWIHVIKNKFAECVEVAMVAWQREHISMGALLRLPEPEFRRGQDSVLDLVKHFMQQYKDIQESRGAFDVQGGFQGGFDRNFTSWAPGFIPGGRSPSSEKP